ncbi:MAG: alkaline phosphatase family protein [Anaerolineales bacterium]
MIKVELKSKALVVLILIGLLAASAGCRPNWSFTLEGLNDGKRAVNFATWNAYDMFAEEGALPLEQILYGEGARVVDSISVTDEDGNVIQYDWAEEANSLQLGRNGLLQGGDHQIRPDSILVVRSKWESLVEAHIYDIAPTAAGALGISEPSLSTGEDLAGVSAESVLLLFLDGFGYLRYQEALDEGLIPVLEGLDRPLLGITTYPPVTSVSTASLLTGTEPPRHGVETRGIRKTDSGTLFDVAREAGLQVVAVEGDALAFNLRGAEVILSGDQDGNGGTDDNVLANTLSVLDKGMPDLFFVHFHGIDDQGHEVGPGAEPEEDKIREVDAAVGQILEALPAGTLVVIFADHGMHQVNEDGRRGNHGHLIPRDMLIPIWVFRK